MVYLTVTALTIISIIVIILLFDISLLQRFMTRIGSGVGIVWHKIGLLLGKVSIAGTSSFTFKRRSRARTTDKQPSGIRQKLSVVHIASFLIIIGTASLCFWLVKYSALDVYHKNEAASTPYNTQINQLLLGERLRPPPAPPEALFAELDAEIASYQASQVDDGYWPEPNTPASIFPSTPSSVGNSAGNDTYGNEAPSVTVPSLNGGNSKTALAAHLNNGYINIRNADRNWNKMNSEFVQRLLTVYKIMKDEHGYDMVLLEGYRSPERQARLLAKGAHVTKAGSYRSYHQFGLAGDSAFIRNGKIVISERDPWAMRGYTLYGKVAKSVGLVWGGDWRMKDLGHVELRKKSVLGKPEMAKILTNQ